MHLDADHLFYAYVVFLAPALVLWGLGYLKAYAFTRRLAYRAIPFVLVIGLFALGFGAEHL